MRKLFLFMMISLDGYFEGPDHDLSWHNVDAEFNDFAIEQTSNIDTLIFGRRTYEMMAGYWPTELAKKDDSVVAGLMNNTPKIVFSHTLNSAPWQNTRLVKDNLAEEITTLKQQPGKDLAVFGSSNLCVSLVEQGLLDELRIMVNPVVLGKGTLLLQGLDQKLPLKLTAEKLFKSGNVLLTYQITQ